MGPCPKGEEVCHRNGNKTDCRLSNLRYGTHSENYADRVAHGGGNQGSRHGMARLTEHEVKEIRQLSDDLTDEVLAKMFFVSPRHINAIVFRRAWRHI